MTNKKLLAAMGIGIFAIIVAVFAQFTIPLPLVPITGQTLAVGLAATVLGSKKGTYAIVLYLILGALGVPVFSGLSAGITKIIGPTGGFLFGFIPAVYVIGLYIEKTKFTVQNAFIANIIGMFIILIIGTFWLKIIADLTWKAAFFGGFAPFILGGVIKAFFAAWLGIKTREKLLDTKLL